MQFYIQLNISLKCSY